MLEGTESHRVSKMCSNPFPASCWMAQTLRTQGCSSSPCGHVKHEWLELGHSARWGMVPGDQPPRHRLQILLGGSACPHASGCCSESGSQGLPSPENETKHVRSTMHYHPRALVSQQFSVMYWRKQQDWALIRHLIQEVC